MHTLHALFTTLCAMTTIVALVAQELPVDVNSPHLLRRMGEVLLPERIKKIYKPAKDAIDKASFVQKVVEMCLARGQSIEACTIAAGACLALQTIRQSARVGGVIPGSYIVPAFDEILCTRSSGLTCCSVRGGCGTTLSEDGCKDLFKGEPAGTFVWGQPCGCPRGCGYACAATWDRHEALYPPKRRIQQTQNYTGSLRDVNSYTITDLINSRAGTYISNYDWNSSNNSMPALQSYLTFRGCKGWVNSTGTADPIPYYSNNTSNETYSRAFDAFRHAQVTAYARIAIPNFWNRYDYINRIAWNSTNRASYLSKLSSSPETIHRQYLSKVGLEVVKISLLDKWDLIAVPLDSEEPFVASNMMVDGCEWGAPPVLEVDFFVTDQVSMTVACKECEWCHVSVDWGDNYLSDIFVENSTSGSLAHGYKLAGQYLVQVTAMNEDGLRTVMRKTVVARSVIPSIQLASTTKINIRVRVPDTRYRYAMLFWGVSNTSGEVYAMASANISKSSAPEVEITLPWQVYSPLSEIQVNCTAFNGVNNVELLPISIISANSTLFSSPKQAVRIERTTISVSTVNTDRNPIFLCNNGTQVISVQTFNVESGTPGSLASVNEIYYENIIDEFNNTKRSTRSAKSASNTATLSIAALIASIIGAVF